VNIALSTPFQSKKYNRYTAQHPKGLFSGFRVLIGTVRKNKGVEWESREINENK
jgi:hypothetical protein